MVVGLGNDFFAQRAPEMSTDMLSQPINKSCFGSVM
jgi:hypothetical protein